MEANMPAIIDTLGFVNVMTYVSNNRRDHEARHHAGMSASLNTIWAYLERGPFLQSSISDLPSTLSGFKRSKGLVNWPQDA